jgi:aerobic-type carbon monoxide dehydrogenase small subunit (CoxS/CutS family)
MLEGNESVRVSMEVNGRRLEADVTADDTLLDVLRDHFRLASCRETCGLGLCGSCTVVVDGRAVSACISPAFALEDARVTTTEGLEDGSGLSPLQQAFVKQQAFQCSFCTPGFLMSATAMLAERPPEIDVENALGGHVCRCGSYRQILCAVRSVVDAGEDKTRSADGI